MDAIIKNKWTMWKLRHGKDSIYNKEIDDKERSDGTIEKWISKHQEYIKSAYEKKKEYNRAYRKRRWASLTVEQRKAINAKARERRKILQEKSKQSEPEIVVKETELVVNINCDTNK